jgi:hypothetical protein
MVEQLVGAASVLVLFLAYLLILQAMTAAVVLLGQFITVQVRVLRSLLAESPGAVPAPLIDQDSGEPYKLGGGLGRW